MTRHAAMHAGNAPLGNTTTESGGLGGVEGSCSSCDTREFSVDMMNRYEHMIALLTAQALSQQEEINQLKTALNEVAILPDVNVDEEQSCKRPSTNGNVSKQHECKKAAVVENTSVNDSKRSKERTRLPKRWRHRVEDHTILLLEKYMRYMDERLARGLVERLRRITREHVIRSLDNEVLRVLQESLRLPQDGQMPLRQAVDYDHHNHQRRMCSTPARCEEKESEANMNHAISPPRAPSREKSTSHEVPVTTTRDARRPSSFKNPPVRLCEVGCGTTAETEPYLSTISTEPSVSGSSSWLRLHLDQSLLGQLQHKVMLLEDRLAAAAFSASCRSESSLLSPPSVEKTLGRDGHSVWGSSLWSPTNSSSVTNVSDDIKVLLDIFEGRQPVNVVEKLFV
ncbi:hypothetical protein MOQ_000548 [Trypanosoma cruzi marinkellei]|uniref:Uncharacterized protein n=1 Tax=Trypanosoma cruzi marinkellei TaxID=85056 RepID=K2NW18_TRYCR|nr:hypothetical protein MOQ_000548 [Trypanosoma cruzi marinkellei]